MKILLTGSFGNLGSNTLRYLLETEHEITCFDLETKNNKRTSKKLLKVRDFDIIWGGITNKNQIRSAVSDKDCIIHLAGLTPPITETKPELAHQINIVGTQNILDVLQELQQTPKIIFSSSFSIYGPQLSDGNMKTVFDPVVQSDVYTTQKIAVENLLKQSNLPWIIFRIAATPSLKLRNNQMDLLYDLPLNQQIDFLHPYDAGYALAKSPELQLSNKILNLGGGEKGKLINREFLGKYLSTLGIGLLPDEAFKQPSEENEWYYSSWMDSKETQQLLKYQNHTFDDFLNQVKKQAGLMARLIKPFSKYLRNLTKKSPYFLSNKEKTESKNNHR